MSMSTWKKKSGKWYLVGLCTLASLGWIFMLFSDGTTYERPDDPLAVADATVHTPHVDMVAARLLQDPIYVDPVLGGTIGEAVDTDEVRAAVEQSDTPVHIIVLPTQGTLSREDDVLLARIADATGREGAYLLFDETGRLRHVTHGLDLGGRTTFMPDIHEESFTEQAVVDAVDEVDPEVDRIHDMIGNDNSLFESPFALGLVLGLTFAVPLWYVMKFVRWSARRDRSYLKGFRE